MIIKENSYVITEKYKFIWFLSTLYCLSLISANWFDARLIGFLNVGTGGGAIIFPITYLIAATITEVYGYTQTRFIIWIALITNVLLMLFCFVIYNLMPSNEESTQNFIVFIHQNIRIIIASSISYIVSENLNSYLVSKLKVKFEGKYTGIRFTLSIILSQATNVITFCPTAFYGVISNINLLYFMITSFFFMVSIEFLLIPIAVRLSKRLKMSENSDVYDINTNFNIFSLKIKNSKT